MHFSVIINFHFIELPPQNRYLTYYIPYKATLNSKGYINTKIMVNRDSELEQTN